MRNKKNNLLFRDVFSVCFDWRRYKVVLADNWIVCSGVRGPPPWEAEGGHPWEEALLILHLLAFPFLRPGTVAYLGGGSSSPAPFGKYKIKRKLCLKSNTWQWQRLRICLNLLLKQGERRFSLLKRILYYTRCTMTESRLNDLALIALHPSMLSQLSTEKIIEMFVQANPRKLKLKRVGEYIDWVNSI